jgi:2-aminoadipate transaminase
MVVTIARRCAAQRCDVRTLTASTRRRRASQSILTDELAATALLQISGSRQAWDERREGLHFCSVGRSLGRPTFAWAIVMLCAMDPRVDELQRRGAAIASVISLAGGLPAAELFPRSALSSSFLRAIRAPRGEALQYGWPEGREGLRAWVAGRLRRRGAAIDEQDVIITSGAQQALDIAIGMLLRRGQRIGCDAESYGGALDLFRARGLKPVASHSGVAACYVMPEISNPRGATMSDAGRARLVAHARKHKIALIEDDAYADLRFDSAAGTPLMALDPRRVWHVGTLSKTVSPGLRVGWLVPPRRFRKAAIESKRAADLQANSLAQALLEDFLSHTDFDRLAERARRFYARRARGLARALRRHLPDWRFHDPEGGFAIWAETGVIADDASFLELALKKGVSVDPGSTFRVDPKAGTMAFRLSFATENSERIDEGVIRLAKTWRQFLRRR